MSIFALLGLILLLLSISLLVYQGMTAFMNMGASDEFRFENITLVDILDVSTVKWLEGFSSVYVQSVAETLLSMPLAILLFAGAIIFFLIHAFTSEKRLRKA